MLMTVAVYTISDLEYGSRWPYQTEPETTCTSTLLESQPTVHNEAGPFVFDTPYARYSPIVLASSESVSSVEYLVND